MHSSRHHRDSPSRKRSSRNSSVKPSYALPTGGVPYVPTDQLHRAFAEVQKRFSQLVHNIDHSEKVDGLSSLSSGLYSLRDLAAAIIESDPHFACVNKVFEDLWLVGFTRPLKLCNKLENAAKDTVQTWRMGFVLDWQGYLCTLRDGMLLFGQMNWLMVERPAPLKEETGVLAARYLLRDIALCLARTYSHWQPHLEKTWMKRAMEVNVQLGGVPYQEALQKEKSREDEKAVKILGRSEESAMVEMVQPASESEEFYWSGGNAEEKVEEIADEERIDEKEKIVEKEEKSQGYGAVSATQRDLQVLRMYEQRNSFIQGLLQAAQQQQQENGKHGGE